MAAEDLKRCIRSFILTIICGNPIMKGAFTTILNGLIVKLDLEIAQHTLALQRLNILNKILSYQINALTAAFDKIRADLNLILGPLASAGHCPGLSKINSVLQSGLGGKQFAAFNKMLYKFQRNTDLSTHLSNLIAEKDKLKQTAQDMIDFIGQYCQ